MGRLNLGRRFLGLRPFSYTKVGLAELVNKPEAEFEVVNCWCAAVAVNRGSSTKVRYSPLRSHSSIHTPLDGACRYAWHRKLGEAI